ncbi:Hypothetical predicted protein, partial [Olea europaea subsp. europaea]
MDRDLHTPPAPEEVDESALAVVARTATNSPSEVKSPDPTASPSTAAAVTTTATITLPPVRRYFLIATTPTNGSTVRTIVPGTNTAQGFIQSNTREPAGSSPHAQVINMPQIIQQNPPQPAKRPAPISTVRTATLTQPGGRNQQPWRKVQQKQKQQAPRPDPEPEPDLGSTPANSTIQSKVLEACKRRDNPNANFTTSERTFILMALAVARDRLRRKPNWEHPREGFTMELCDKVRKILCEPSYRGTVRTSLDTNGQERKSPSDNVIRDIWTSFIKNGTPARSSNGGRKRNEDVRTKIWDILREAGDHQYSARELADLTGASRALANRARNEFEQQKRKRKIKTATTTTGNTAQYEPGRQQNSMAQ